MEAQTDATVYNDQGGLRNLNRGRLRNLNSLYIDHISHGATLILANSDVTDGCLITSLFLMGARTEC